MPFSPWIVPIGALLFYGALLNILALRRRWSLSERRFVLYLVVILCNTFTLSLIFGNWFDSQVTAALSLAFFYTEVALALFFSLFVRAFLQLDERFPTVFLVGLVLFLGLVLFAYTPYTFALGARTFRASEISFSIGLSLLLFFYAYAAVLTLYQYRRRTSPLHRNRLLYFTIALALEFAAAWFNVFSGNPTQPLPMVLRAAGLGIFAYALLRHNLADLYYLLRQMVNYVLLSALTIGIYVISVQASTRLFGQAGQAAGLAPVLVAAAALALVYQPLHDVLQRVLDAALFGRSHSYQGLIQEYSQRLSRLKNQETFAADALVILKTALGARQAKFLIPTPDDTGYALQTQPDGLAFHLKTQDPVLQEFVSGRKYLLQYDLDLHPRFHALDPATRITLSNFHAEVWVPIFCWGEWVGLYALGPKLSGDRYTAQDLALLTTLAEETVLAFQNVRLETERRAQESEKHQIREMLQRYVAPSVVRHLLSDPRRASLGGERQLVTVLFADLQGFTALSEQLPAKELVQVLNGYLDRAAQVVLGFEGTLDKFMGDGLMAVFNAPMPQSNHAQRAAQAALRIQKSTAYYAAQFPAAKRLCFRIGVHTGEAIVGNVGGAELMNYTAVGDTVNVAKRLEENAQPGQVLVSEETFILIATMVKGRPLENLVVKGRTRPIKVFEIAGL